jgi:hypothetical protein
MNLDDHDFILDPTVQALPFHPHLLHIIGTLPMSLPFLPLLFYIPGVPPITLLSLPLLSHILGTPSMARYLLSRHLLVHRFVQAHLMACITLRILRCGLAIAL